MPAQRPEVPKPREIVSTFERVAGRKLSSIGNFQEMETYLQQNTAVENELKQANINRQDLKNHMEKGMFKKLLTGTAGVGKGLLKAAWWPVEKVGKLGLGILKFPIKHPYLTMAALAAAYFGAPYLLQLWRRPEGMAAEVGLDWFRRLFRADRMLGTGLGSAGDLGNALGGSYGVPEALRPM